MRWQRVEGAAPGHCVRRLRPAGRKKYVANTRGLLTPHFLPGYAPDLNPEALVWRYTPRTGVARSLLKRGENLQQRRHDPLSELSAHPALIRSFFQHPSVRYLSDW